MSTLYMMVGIPASGKSTFAKTLKGKYVSRDIIRFSLIKDGDAYFSKENEVFAKFIYEIETGLAAGQDVIVDATHINERSRAKLFRALGSSMYGVELTALYFKTPLEVALTRNENRSGLAYVPASAIISMNSNLTEPTFVEGFNQIYIIEDNKLYQKVELQDD